MQLNIFNETKHDWKKHWLDMPVFFPPTRNTEERNKIDISDMEVLSKQKTKLFPKYSIYIISKGRYKKPKTANALKKLDIDFKIVVEPKEFKEYKKIIDSKKIIVTPENFSEKGFGSIPARNFVLDYSRKKQEKKHWILDDNLDGFGFQKNGRRINSKTNGDFLRQCEIFVDRYSNIKISGIRYRFHHNYVKSPYYLNTRIYSCILIDNSIKHRWRGKYNEDTDLSLRVLKDGDCTLLFTWCYCNKVATQTMKGGNTDSIYKNSRNRLDFAKSLKKQHPNDVKIVWRFNRWHHLVNYKPFRKNILKKHTQ